MAPKKKAKKRATPRVITPKDPTYEYLVEDIASEITTDDLHLHCNQRGAQGWRLVNVGSVVHGTPNMTRLWWIK